MSARDERRWWFIPATVLALIGYPLLRLWQLPNNLRLWRLERRLVKDFTAYHRVRRARWFMRERAVMDEDSLYALVLDDGNIVVVRGDDEGRVHRALEQLLRPEPIHLGSDGDELAWIVWILTMGALAIVAFAIALSC